MKTDILNAPKSVSVDSAISLDNFIVSETIAKDVLTSSAKKVAAKTVFTPADLWNIRKRSKMTSIRRSR